MRLPRAAILSRIADVSANSGTSSPHLGVWRFGGFEVGGGRSALRSAGRLLQDVLGRPSRQALWRASDQAVRQALHQAPGLASQTVRPGRRGGRRQGARPTSAAAPRWRRCRRSSRAPSCLWDGWLARGCCRVWALGLGARGSQTQKAAVVHSLLVGGLLHSHHPKRPPLNAPLARPPNATPQAA